MQRFVDRCEAEEASLATIVAMRPLMAALRRCDGALASQLVRALSNMAMSAARSGFGPRGERRRHLLSAVASASEAHALLQMAVDWHYCSWPHARPARDSLAATRTLLTKLARLSSAPRRPHPARRRAA
jgi:hypothetical protein